MFGVRLKQLRTDMKLTQKELAKSLGISPSTIGMYEQGRRDPDTETVKRLSRFFGVSTDYLIGAIPVENFLNPKDEKEITNILERTEKILKEQEGLLFDGEPISKEAIDSIISAMKIGIERAKAKNKKFATKKNLQKIK